MAPSALLPDWLSPPTKTVPGSKPNMIPEPDSGFTAKAGEKYNDFRDDLLRDGYAVIKNAIPRDRALGYQQKALNWLNSFDRGLDLKNPDTWIKENLPVQSKISTFNAYAVPHEKFMWDAKMEPGVLDVFQKMWGTDELLVSFDALNITLPNRKDVPRKMPWEHVDQSPLREGLQCVQGIINLSVAGPDDGGLTVYPGSHKYMREYFDTQTNSSEWTKDDYYPFHGSALDFFKAKGIEAKKVCADIGDVIVWDSRTIHYGAEPTEKSSEIRTVIYATYTPAKLATADALRIKSEIFEEYGGTTHWPHDNINVRRNKPIREDGEVDPKNRTVPLDIPEKTDQLLKLAGVMSY